MAKRDVQEFIRRRPSVFWWTLANLLAAAFAVISWTTCHYLFNFPEKPANYRMLRKISRLPPVVEFPIAEAPEGRSLPPQDLYADYLKPDAEALAGLNRQYKRNYISNYKWDEFLTYVEGTYRITHLRTLKSGDIFRHGLVIGAQAYVQPDDERKPPSPYPVVLELLLPTPGEPGKIPFKAGDEITLQAPVHRAAVLYAAKTGLQSEPVICLTVVPLTYDAFKTGERALNLAPPDPLDPAAPFPVMEENRNESKGAGGR